MLLHRLRNSELNDSSRVYKAITQAAITSHYALRTGADGDRFWLVLPHYIA